METLAQKIAEFVKFNNIDPLTTPMDEIVSGYFKAQNEMYETIANQAFTSLR